MNPMWIVQFLVLMVVVVGPIIFFLHRFIISSTDGAVKRLDDEAEKMRKKQSDLNQRLKEADEELSKRKAEADALASKMIATAEEKAREEREKIVNKARAEGEEIITKAQNTRDKIRKEIEKEMDLRVITQCTKIITDILSTKARGSLDKQLIEEFIQSLGQLDMTHISSDVETFELISVDPLEEAVRTRVQQVFADKLKRPVKITNSTDPALMAGVMLRFGTLGIDASLRNMIKDAGATLKQRVEEAYT